MLSCGIVCVVLYGAGRIVTCTFIEYHYREAYLLFTFIAPWSWVLFWVLGFVLVLFCFGKFWESVRACFVTACVRESLPRIAMYARGKCTFRLCVANEIAYRESTSLELAAFLSTSHRLGITSGDV